MSINFNLKDGYHFFATSPKKEALGYLKKWERKAKEGYELAKQYPDEYLSPEEQEKDLERLVKEIDRINKWIVRVEGGEDDSLWMVEKYWQRLYKKG